MLRVLDGDTKTIKEKHDPKYSLVKLTLYKKMSRAKYFHNF